MIGSITRSIVNYKYCSYCLVVMPRYTVHTGAEHFCRTEINDWLTVWLKVVLSTPFIIPSFMKFWHISKRQVRVSIRWSVTVAHTGSTSCVATPSTPTSSAAPAERHYSEVRPGIYDAQKRTRKFDKWIPPPPWVLSWTFCKKTKQCASGWSVSLLYVWLATCCRRLHHEHRCVSAKSKPSN